MNLALYGVTIFERLAVEILIAASLFLRRHILHPKVVGVNADWMNGLLKAELDFESKTVNTDDFARIECRIATHQNT